MASSRSLSMERPEPSRFTPSSMPSPHSLSLSCCCRVACDMGEKIHSIFRGRKFGACTSNKYWTVAMPRPSPAYKMPYPFSSSSTQAEQLPFLSSSSSIFITVPSVQSFVSSCFPTTFFQSFQNFVVGLVL